MNAEIQEAHIIIAVLVAVMLLLSFLPVRHFYRLFFEVSVPDPGVVIMPIAHSCFLTPLLPACHNANSFVASLLVPLLYFVYLENETLNLYTGGITPKRVTSGGVHLRASVWATQFRINVAAFGNTVSNLTSPGIELQTSRTDIDVGVSCWRCANSRPSYCCY